MGTDKHALPPQTSASPTSSPAKGQGYYAKAMAMLQQSKHTAEQDETATAAQQQAARMARLGAIFGTPPRMANTTQPPTAPHPAGKATTTTVTTTAATRKVKPSTSTNASTHIPTMNMVAHTRKNIKTHTPTLHHCRRPTRHPASLLPNKTTGAQPHELQRVGTPSFYFERQTGSNCQAHALNNLMGFRLVSPSTLQAFIAHKMETAPDPETREHWRWSAYNEVTAQGPLSGFGDDVVKVWLEETQNLTQLKIGVIHDTLDNKLHALNTEADKHSTHSFICKSINHAFAIKKINSS
eukprot:1144455-Pelagomonas_calceolata.AAC.1